jgi:hypothetical protein
VCYESLTKLGKRDKPPKVLTGRLKTLSQLIGNYQLSKNYENVIRYSLKYADDKNSEVRTAAIQLICTISNEIGYTSMQTFLKSLRPQILKTIEEKLAENGGLDDQEQPLAASKKSSEQIPIRHKKE